MKLVIGDIDSGAVYQIGDDLRSLPHVVLSRIWGRVALLVRFEVIMCILDN